MVLNFSSVQSCRPKREDLSPVVYPNPRSRDKIHRQMYGKVTSWLCNHSLHSFKGFNTVITGTPLRWTTKVGPCNCTLVTHFTVTELPKDKHLVATSSIFKNSKHFWKQLYENHIQQMDSQRTLHFATYLPQFKTMARSHKKDKVQLWFVFVVVGKSSNCYNNSFYCSWAITVAIHVLTHILFSWHFGQTS